MNLVETIQNKLRENKIAAYVIPTSDYHQSEYISDYFKIRAYISGFTGSAGTLVITQNEARLWTDGRYFLQAEHQLEGSGISLMKMGQPKVRTVYEYLSGVLTENAKLLFDGKLVSVKFIQELEKKLTNAVSYETVDNIVI